MWEASTAIIIILVLTLGLGILFGPGKEKPRQRTRQEFEIAGRPHYDHTVTINSPEASQAASGTPNSLRLPEQKATAPRYRENEL
jgi:hypothetical protein